MFSLTPAFVDLAVPASSDLLALAQQGDGDAFCELCRIYETPLLRQATKLCGDLALAEDLAQDTLFQAWKSIRRFNGRCQFFTWVCAILLNRYRNVVRRDRPVALSTLSTHGDDGAENILENLADSGASPDQLTEFSERAEFLRRCLARLPDKHREVIYLRFYVDQSLDGIAAALDCSVGTVKSRLFHALEKLRMMNGLGAHVEELKRV